MEIQCSYSDTIIMTTRQLQQATHVTYVIV